MNLLAFMLGGLIGALLASTILTVACKMFFLRPR